MLIRTILHKINYIWNLLAPWKTIYVFFSSFEGDIRATPAVAHKTGPVLFIWVLSVFLGVQNFFFHSTSTT